jgi:8-hydroxy-5-deazaflavin:NADPH oxidoreductase
VAEIKINGRELIPVFMIPTQFRTLGQVVVIGGLERGRQLEEVAGFVVRLVGLGVDPATAIPAVPAR